MSEFSVVGRRLPKVNVWAHLTGTAKYADDILLPRMLFGRLLRSPHPHARIVRIDVSRAVAHPGVVAIVTGADMPEKMGIMPSTQDETALAVDKVRYVGEPVAAVAALDEDTAFDALSLIDVEYEPLEPIFTIEEALAREDVRIHDSSKRANVFKEVHLSFGDLEGGFAAADLVRDDWFFFEGSTHAAIESHSCVASYDGDGKLTLWTCTQVPHYLHRELEKVLHLPRARIRVIATPNGGAFGGKSDPFNGDVSNRMRIAQEEIFGPVLGVIRFRDEDEAIGIANDVRYGLAAGVWTEDVRRALRVSSRLQVGTVWVNTYRAISFMTPFGGRRMSGIGRENGADAINEYLQVKSVWLNCAETFANPFTIR